jgi:hypothetical protein
VDTLLSSADPSSPVYTSLTSIKSIMESLASALTSYLALIQTRRNRFRRATVITILYLFLMNKEYKNVNENMIGYLLWSTALL